MNLLANQLEYAVNKLINKVDPHINMGIVVADLNTGKILFQRNEKRPLIPASNMKLFSDAAALMALGPDYQFKSVLSTDARLLEGGVLKGTLYLHLTGDPSFNHHHLKYLLKSLAKLGVVQIQGNIIIDSDHSVVTPYAPGRSTTDARYSYGAPVAPLILDENRLTLTVNPSSQGGEAALIEFAEEGVGVLLNNQVKTANNKSRCGVGFNMDQNNLLTIRGCVNQGQWAIQQKIPIRNPLRYAEDIIRLQLAEFNIQLNGQIHLGHMPNGTLLLGKHLSKPIAYLIADTLKPSDNLYADSLYLHTAAKLKGYPVNWEDAQNTIKQFLQQQTGINFNEAHLRDGSGLSRLDLISAEQTVKLLHFLHTRFPLTYEYIAALPIAGFDGTLQKRFANQISRDY